MRVARFIVVPIPSLVLVTLALIAGISAQAYDISFLVRYGFLVVCAAICILCTTQHEQVYRHLCLLLFCSLSFVWGSYWFSKKIHDYAMVERSVSSAGQLQGIVVDVQERSRGLYKQVITLALEAVEACVLPYGATYSIKIYTRHPFAVSLGDRVTYAKMSSWTPPLRNTHYSCVREGLIAHFFASSVSPIEVVHNDSVVWGWRRYWARARARLARSIESKLSPEVYRFFALIFLGAPGQQDDHISELRERFSYWGITHYLARSGLHVTMVLAVWQGLMRFIPVRLVVKRMLLLMILALYTLLSWSSISFVRAALSYALSQIYTMTAIQTHPVHTIALTCFLVLLYNPFYLFSISFQLSFALAFALAWSNYVERMRQRKHSNQLYHTIVQAQE